ncbi:hypothetical protein BH11CYA1_BH11CYA1_35700 [soil metagenome]
MFTRINSIAKALRRHLSSVIRGNAVAFPPSSNDHSPDASSTANAGDYVPFANLSRHEQAIVTRYLISVAEILGLLDCIQHRGRAVDHHSVLSNFGSCEAQYISAGFMPFIPGALKASGLSSLEPRSIDCSRLVRRSSGDNHACFAQAIRQQVERSLRSGKVIQLDSRALELRMQELCAASRADQIDCKD